MPRKVLVLAATTKGVFYFQSDESRRDWKLAGPFLAGWEVYSVLGDSRHGHRIFAGTHHSSGGATIQVSENLGQSWAPVPRGPRFPEPGEFDWDNKKFIPNPMQAQRPWTLKRVWQITPGAPSEPDVYYAGTEEAGIFVSRDGGYEWDELPLTQHPTRPYWGPGAGGMGLHTILVNPTNPDQIWVALSAVGVFRSDDAGQTWSVCNHNVDQVPTADLDPLKQLGRCAHKVCLDPDDPRTLYMQDHGGVYKSTDAADSWFKIENGLGAEGDERFGFPIAISRTGDLYLMPLKSSEERTVRGGRMILYRSTDRGQSWHPVPGDFPATTQYVNVLRDGMCVDPLETYGVYFGTSSGEVFFSTDRGATWGRMPAQLPRITAVKTWIIEG